MENALTLEDLSNAFVTEDLMLIQEGKLAKVSFIYVYL